MSQKFVKLQNKNRVSVVSFVLDGIPVPETGILLDKSD